ncbi:hypothetical protein B0H66DRAFT_621489 [Apodospora peruviana]|uniref:Uncharacterized protein n=1 Tax=Apodospora peruviana TaxID=516989 RepID=A0AAE0M441_9PEZI|nr:hypothetical protein B0H66DRAFT_621489 [Apodospora peruviana]
MGFTWTIILAQSADKSKNEDLFYLPDASGRRTSAASECSIDPCTRTYSGLVNRGNISETIEAQAFECGDPEGGLRFSSVEVPCLNDQEVSDLRSHGYVLEAMMATAAPVGGWPTTSPATPAPIQTSTSGRIPRGWMYIQPKCIFQTNIEDINSVGDLLAPIFSACTATVNETFARVAQSMTVYGRNTQYAYQQAAEGLVFTMDTCVHVEWL